MPFQTHCMLMLLAAAAGIAVSQLEWPRDPELRWWIECVLVLVVFGTFAVIILELGGLN